MKTYRVISPLRVNGKRRDIGQIVKLDEATAVVQLERGRVEEASDDEPAAPPKGGPLIGDLVAAIGQLDPEDPSLWMKDGRPKTEALTVVGAVTAAERDAAWEAYKAKAAQQ